MSTPFVGEEIRGSDIPKRQQPELLPAIESYALMMIPLNGKPYAVDETMIFDDSSEDQLGIDYESLEDQESSAL